MSNLVDLTVYTPNEEHIKVADIKADFIRNVIESAKLCSRIDSIILFGSALEERCTERSNIDIVIISSYTVLRLSGLKSFHNFLDAVYSEEYMQEYDMLYFKSIEQIEKEAQGTFSICTELINKGKLIYKRIT